jgi:outer membrane protein assembly factor BamA
VEEPVVYLTAAPETVGVFWPIVPLPRANRLGVVLGYSQGRKEGGGRLSGQVDLLLPNLAGTGRRLAAGWSDDGVNLRHLGFGYLEPLAFGTPLDLEVALDQEVATGAYSRFRLDGRAQLSVVAAWGIEFGLGWDRSTFPSGALERTSRLRARGAFLHRRLDARRSGWSGTFAIETASRQAIARMDTTTTSSALASGSEERQRLLSFDIAGELWLGRVWSLAGRSGFREVQGEGGPIPLSEQYRFGGANSVRGYREDEFHGERVLFGGVELRIGQPGRSRLYTFLDLGYFEFSAPAPTPVDPARREQREGTVRGFGLGLQTRTPAGDISLAIGFPGSVNFDDAKLHVSLLEAF